MPELARLSHDFVQPADQVWQAVVDPALRSQWFGDADLPMEEGAPARVSLPPRPFSGGDLQGTVVYVVPGRTVAADLSDGRLQDARLQLHVMAKGDGSSRFELVHRGLEDQPVWVYAGWWLRWRRRVDRLVKVVDSLS